MSAEIARFFILRLSF